MSKSVEERYLLVKTLDESAYVARDTLSSDLVIVKAMRDATDPRAIRTELELLKGFASNYCIRYIDAFEKDGRVWVVMEYCRCGSLQAYLSGGNRLKEDELREVVSCCLLGLSYLHNRNVMHRDFRPGNLFIARSGVVKLGGFESRSQRLREVAELYDAPEVSKGRDCTKSDVWSLGVSVIEMAEGRSSLSSQVMQKGETPSLTSSGWSSDLIDFVKRCLVTDASERASVEALLKHPFVRDSTARLLKNGDSSLLLELAKRVSASNQSADDDSDNMILISTVNKPKSEDTKELTSTKEKAPYEKVFVMTVDRDFYQQRADVDAIQMNANLCNDPDMECWRLDVYPGLKALLIGDGCLGYLKKLSLEGMKSLERVGIGEGCLQRVEELRMTALNQLREVVVGSNCFTWTTVFEMRKCKRVERVVIGDSCFVHCASVVFENLGALEEVSLGQGVFEGDEMEKNVLVMKNLPSLRILNTSLNAFRNTKTAILVSIPYLEQLTLQGAFYRLHSVEMTDASLFEAEAGKQAEVGSITEWNALSNFVGTITMKERSCNDMLSFDCSRIVCLQELVVSDDCLQRVTTMRVIGLVWLRSVIMGDRCCVHCETVVFEDLPQLETLKIGDEVFKGDEEKKNALAMKDLTALRAFHTGMKSLRNVKEVELVNIPRLMELTLCGAFKSVERVVMKNASKLMRLEELVEGRKRTEEEARGEKARRRRECVKGCTGCISDGARGCCDGVRSCCDRMSKTASDCKTCFKSKKTRDILCRILFPGILLFFIVMIGSVAMGKAGLIVLAVYGGLLLILLLIFSCHMCMNNCNCTCFFDSCGSGCEERGQSSVNRNGVDHVTSDLSKALGKNEYESRNRQ